MPLKPIIELSSKDVRDMNRQLRAIEPGLLREMRKEIRAIAKPIDQQIKQNIPAQAPMSGMAKGNGRLRWFGDKKHNKRPLATGSKPRVVA